MLVHVWHRGFGCSTEKYPNIEQKSTILTVSTRTIDVGKSKIKAMYVRSLDARLLIRSLTVLRAEAMEEKLERRSKMKAAFN